ncbi:MAG: NAD-dependent epimerase/dehydratase family protein [Solirubrobacteraceae bacterium]
MTGGTGFIGSHTVRALANLGHSCLVTSHRTSRDLGETISIEHADVADRYAMVGLGERHAIDGIVHLADPALAHLHDPNAGPATLVTDMCAGADALFNVLECAIAWDVRRVTVASTIGVYGGLPDLRGVSEDLPLQMAAGGNVVTASKKRAELIVSLFRARGVDAINVRLAAIWGPRGRKESRFFAAPGLIHAAVSGEGQLWFAKQIKADYGVTNVFADAWSAPAFMKTNRSAIGGGTVCGEPGATGLPEPLRHAKAGDPLVLPRRVDRDRDPSGDSGCGGCRRRGGCRLLKAGREVLPAGRVSRLVPRSVGAEVAPWGDVRMKGVAAPGRADRVREVPNPVAAHALRVIQQLRLRGFRLTGGARLGGGRAAATTGSALVRRSTPAACRQETQGSQHRQDGHKPSGRFGHSGHAKLMVG